jgi:hemerythrin-like domain-containing protein
MTCSRGGVTDGREPESGTSGPRQQRPGKFPVVRRPVGGSGPSTGFLRCFHAHVLQLFQGAHVNAVDMLTSQHREVEALLRAAEQTTADTPQERVSIGHDIVDLLSRHVAIEEAALYPVLQGALPDFDVTNHLGRGRHDSLKANLQALEGCDASSEAFDRLIASLAASLREHVNHGEDEVFPVAQDVLKDADLDELGGNMERLMKVVPRPPETAPPQTASVAAGPIIGAIDRLREQVRERASDNPT